MLRGLLDIWRPTIVLNWRQDEVTVPLAEYMFSLMCPVQFSRFQRPCLHSCWSRRCACKNFLWVSVHLKFCFHLLSVREHHVLCWYLNMRSVCGACQWVPIRQRVRSELTWPSVLQGPYCLSFRRGTPNTISAEIITEINSTTINLAIVLMFLRSKRLPDHNQVRDRAGGRDVLTLPLALML